MSTCSRPTYGVAELLALVAAVLRPWLDALRTEFARPTVAPIPPQPAPLAEPRLCAEPVAVPVAPAPELVAQVPAVAALESPPATTVAVPTAEAEQSPPPSAERSPAEPLFVRKGGGRGSRYVEAGPDDVGPRYRRTRVGRTRTAYVAA